MKIERWKIRSFWGSTSFGKNCYRSLSLSLFRSFNWKPKGERFVHTEDQHHLIKKLLSFSLSLSLSLSLSKSQKFKWRFNWKPKGERFVHTEDRHHLERIAKESVEAEPDKTRGGGKKRPRVTSCRAGKPEARKVAQRHGGRVTAKFRLSPQNWAGRKQSLCPPLKIEPASAFVTKRAALPPPLSPPSTDTIVRYAAVIFPPVSEEWKYASGFKGMLLDSRAPNYR